MLDPNQSRERQKRLLAIMEKRNLDAVVVGLPRHVYYFSTFHPHSLHYAAVALRADGRSCLISANEPAGTKAIDESIAYEAQWMATLRQEQPMAIAESAAAWLAAGDIRRLGLDTSPVSLHLARRFGENAELIDEEIWQMRRCKDADELSIMKSAIELTDAMYKRALEIIEPGIEEVTVFAELQRAAVEKANEPLTDLLGNDFACDANGGPPRAGRTAQAGQIYILDLGPSYRGYFADNSRSFAVNGEPTQAQERAYRSILLCFDIFEHLAKPGARCRDLFAAVNDHLSKSMGRPLPHHLGHGVGLQAHEFPHLNPKWDDVLMPGEVVAVEPGVYGDDLGGGIRIEDQYLVTPTGVQNLVKFPRSMR